MDRKNILEYLIHFIIAAIVVYILYCLLTERPGTSLSLIWGLGLPKTGTTSLTKAIQRLTGQKVVHASSKTNYRLEQLALEGYPSSAIPSQFIGALEMPAIRRYYKEIYQEDPQAQFILTTRELTSWLDSMEAHKRKNPHRRLWDIFNNTRQDLAKHYGAYHVDVFKFFRDSGNLLIIDIIQNTDAQNWKKLANFLDVDPPEGQTFPHKNATEDEYFLRK